MINIDADPSFNKFKALTTPGNLNKEELGEFLIKLEIDKNFTYYILWIGQNRYSMENLDTMARAISTVSFGLQICINVWGKRVSKENKEIGYKAYVKLLNINRLLREAVKEPVKLALRGSDTDE